MKKLFVLAFITMLCIACSTEEETTISGDTNLEVVLENYKGIFTTTNGLHRGTLDITLSQDGRSASGELTLVTGEIVSIFTDQVSDLGNRKEVIFNSNELSFILITGEEGETLEIDTVTFRGVESSILASKNTERAPVTPITGTYACTGCPAPLNNAQTQTFNLMFTTANGNSTMATQTTLGMTVYNGVGMQDSCAAGSSQTTCDINSGDGMTNVGVTAGGGPVTWTGTHTFDNGASGPSDCSGASGTWSWASPTLGTLNGTFTSDAMCAPPLTQLVFEDFEDSTVGYIVRDESAGIDRGENTSDSMASSGGDYIGRVSAANFPAGTFQLNNVQGSSVFGAGDVDGVPAPWSTASDNSSIRWENINVSGMTTLTVSALIGERLQTTGSTPYDFGVGTSVRIETSFNNTTWTPIFQILGPTSGGAIQGNVDADVNGVGDGVFIDNTLTEYTATAPTNGNSTMSVRIFFNDFDSGHEDLAIDNVTISGN